MNRKTMLKRFSNILILVVVVVFVVVCGFLVDGNKKNVDDTTFDIYFLEYENEYEKEDSIIFKYDTQYDMVVEIGRVQGYLYNCIMNDEENYITGLLSNGLIDSGFDIVQYDLATKEVELIVVKEKIYELIQDGDIKGTLLYEGGEKIIISYHDDKGKEWWLFYDIVTGQQEVIEGEADGTVYFITINNDCLWYVVKGVLYQYNLESQTKIKIIDSVGSAVIAENGSQIAYIKQNNYKKIYLYDMDSGKERCLISSGWNFRYDDLFRIDSKWCNDGSKIFYIKSFSRFFNASDMNLMIYDVETDKTYCIYKVINTQHSFRYIQIE